MTDNYPWRVMVSSTMRDLELERKVMVAQIEAAHLKPLWAEGNPAELSKHPRAFCKEMAESCHLYFLIVGSTYGFTPEGEPADNGRSITELELDWASAINLRKIVIFVRSDALNTPDPKQRALIERIRNFERGYVTFPPFSTLDELAEQVRQAITNWLQVNESGRAIWLSHVVNQYATMQNIVTKTKMAIGQTALLKLRTEVSELSERRTWDNVESSELTTNRHNPSTVAQHLGAFLRGKVDASRQEPIDYPTSRPNIYTTQQLLNEFSRLVVVGDPGSGKSTLLRRQAYDTASQALQQPVRTAPQPLIPVYVAAPTLAQAIKPRASDHHSAADSLADVESIPFSGSEKLAAFAETLASLATIDMSGAEAHYARIVLVDAITRGESLLLVDGLDEVGGSQREPLLSALETIGGNHAILTLRPNALQQGILQQWRTCEIQQLDQSRKREVIAFTLENLSVTLEPGIMQQGISVTSLENELEKRPDLFAWSGNPLLLTLLTLLYGKTGALPAERAQIYAFAVEELLHGRGSTATSMLSSPDQLRASLEALALRMMREAVVTVSFTQLGTWASTSGKPFSEAALWDLLVHASLLQQQSPGQWGFIHLTFQEYLAACAIGNMPERTQRQEILQHRLSAWWEQVYLLLISVLDSSPENRRIASDAIIRWLIDADGKRIAALKGGDPTHRSLRLATRCQYSRIHDNRDNNILSILRRRWQSLWTAFVLKASMGSDIRAVGSLIDELIDADTSVYDNDVELPYFLSICVVILDTPKGWLRRKVSERALVIALLSLAAVLIGAYIWRQAEHMLSASIKVNVPVLVVIVVSLLLALCIRILLFQRRKERVNFTAFLTSLQVNDVISTLNPSLLTPMVHSVRQSLYDSEWPIPALGIASLESLGSAGIAKEEAIEALHEWIVHTRQPGYTGAGYYDPQLIVVAIKTLARMISDCANIVDLAEMLLPNLEDGPIAVRRATARVLEELGPKVATEHIIAALVTASLDDDHAGVRQAARNALVVLAPAVSDVAIREIRKAVESWLDRGGFGYSPIAHYRNQARRIAESHANRSIKLLKAGAITEAIRSLESMRRSGDDIVEIEDPHIARVLERYRIKLKRRRYKKVAVGSIRRALNFPEWPASATDNQLLQALTAAPAQRYISVVSKSTRLLWTARTLFTIRFVLDLLVIMTIVVGQAISVWPSLGFASMRLKVDALMWWQVPLAAFVYIFVSVALAHTAIQLADSQAKRHSDALRAMERIVRTIDNV